MYQSWFALWLWILISHAAQAELVVFSDIRIECEPSGVEIILNSTALEDVLPNLNVDTLRVGDGPWLPHCKPKVGSDEVLRYGHQDWTVFKFGYGDCHPEIQDFTDTKVRLVYDVLGERKVEGEETPSGTRVSCIVPKDGLISAHMAQNSNVYKYVGSDSGEYQFAMTLYKDPFMTNPISDDEDIPLGMTLWVGIKLNSTDKAEMYVKDCWATPTPSHAPDQTQHMFIRNGLIGEDDETFSPMDDVITATTYGFSFDSFMFRGSGSRVYIKCHVHVCDASLTDSYKEICSIPRYPEFSLSGRDLAGELGSGSGSGYGLGIETRDLGEANGIEEEEEDEEEVDDLEERELEEREFPQFYVMHSFTVRHSERKRRSAGSYRVIPKRTMFSNLHSGIMLGIIIASTAMLSAVAILLPLHLSGEKVRCVAKKPVKRTI